MKRLIAIRHGKSSWDYDCRDKERPLKQRGIDDARLIGNYLDSMSFQPDAVWSSPAIRALSTAVLLTEHFGYPHDSLDIVDALYTFNASAQLEVVKSCSDKHASLCIFSHNNGLTELVNRLGSETFENIPTTGVVMIEFPVDSWKDIEKGTTTFHIFAKDLK